MTREMTLRLTGQAVALIDELVAQGGFPSREAAIAHVVEREMRWRAFERDREILLASGPGDDLDPLVEWTAARERALRP